jgi:magnesium transporter
MTERAERTNDVLGKLTVLGTIVLPMNIVTGLWGMNTRVPGEKAADGDLRWFSCITGGLVMGGLLCYLIARRTLGVV